MRLIFLVCLSNFIFNGYGQDKREWLIGNWAGIDMYQDQDTYDGKNYYLPNKEFLVIDNDLMKIYFYPYSKSDEFQITVNANTIRHSVGGRVLETAYDFTNDRHDTLVFTMHFISKTFIKMYSRVTSTNSNIEIDYATLAELDQYGFNPSAVTHLFELDTFHKDLWFGFNALDSLEFDPYRFLQFVNDNSLSLNRGDVVSINRGFKTISFTHNGITEKFKISHAEGTQSFSIIPLSLCQCDSIIIPYLTVDWANRIRKDMIENKYKYR